MASYFTFPQFCMCCFLFLFSANEWTLFQSQIQLWSLSCTCQEDVLVPCLCPHSTYQGPMSTTSLVIWTLSSNVPICLTDLSSTHLPTVVRLNCLSQSSRIKVLRGGQAVWETMLFLFLWLVLNQHCHGPPENQRNVENPGDSNWCWMLVLKDKISQKIPISFLSLR